MGDHNYGSGGNRPISVTVHHESSPAVAVTGSAVVTELAVKPNRGVAISAIEGLDIGGQALATFTDPAGAEGLAHYSATIDWGDGTTSAGTVSYGGTPGSSTGVFTVTGSHAYAAGGNYPINVTVHHTFAPDVTIASSAAVTPVINLVTFLSGPVVKIGRHRFMEEVQIYNVSPFPISGHFALALDGLGLGVRHGQLRLTGAALLNARGFIPGPSPFGSPFLFAAFGPAALDSPQGGVIFLEFAAPKKSDIQFTPRLLEGPNLF